MNHKCKNIFGEKTCVAHFQWELDFSIQCKQCWYKVEKHDIHSKCVIFSIFVMGPMIVQMVMMKTQSSAQQVETIFVDEDNVQCSLCSNCQAT